MPPLADALSRHDPDALALSPEDARAALADQLATEKHPRSLAVQAGPVRDDAGKVGKPAGRLHTQGEHRHAA